MASAVNQVRYRRVEKNEDNVDEGEKKKQRAELIEKIVTKLQAMFWIATSVALIYYTDLPKRVMEDSRIDRLFLNIAIVCISINVVIMGYLTLWVPYQERLLSKRLGKPKKLDWEVYCPRMIPTMTVLGLLFFFSAAKAIWPVYGLLTPIILLVLFVGFIFATHFIPWIG